MPKGDHGFKKGHKAVNLPVRTKATPAQKMITWHLRESARQFGEEALDVVVAKMRSKDERLALAAAVEILNRGWGKPQEALDVTMTHSFAEVPQVMKIEDWLRTRGQPQLLPPKAEDEPGGKLN